MGTLIISILLFIIASTLFIILTPFSILTHAMHAVFNYRNTQILKYLSDVFHTMALALDKIGCVLLAPILNLIAIRPESKYKFGNINDTISYILAANLPKKYTSDNIVNWKKYSMNFKIFNKTFSFKIPTGVVITQKYTTKVTKFAWQLIILLEILDPGHMMKTIKRRY
jgi:hypothetical protein